MRKRISFIYLKHTSVTFPRTRFLYPAIRKRKTKSENPTIRLAATSLIIRTTHKCHSRFAYAFDDTVVAPTTLDSVWNDKTHEGSLSEANHSNMILSTRFVFFLLVS